MDEKHSKLFCGLGIYTELMMAYMFNAAFPGVWSRDLGDESGLGRTSNL